MKYGQYHFDNAMWRRGPLATGNQKKVEFVENFIQSLINTIDELENKLAAAEAENAKDERVKAAEEKAKKAKEYADEAFSSLYCGFTKEDKIAVKKWWDEHTKEERESLEKTKKCLGKGSHKITYTLYPTELGMIKTVKCSCGQTLDLTKKNEFG